MKNVSLVFLFFLVLPSTSLQQENEILKIEKALLHVVSGDMPTRYKIRKNKKSLVVIDAKARRELAFAIKNASDKWNIDPYLLVSISFREGRFLKKIKSKSAIGEKSTFQIAPRTEKFLKNKVESSCTTETYEGAALCAASLLVVYARSCGNMRGAVTKYATGNVCNPKSKRLRWLTNDRISMSLYLAGAVKN